MIALQWLVSTSRSRVSPTYLNKGKSLRNTAHALLSLLNPTGVPIHSLWGLLASLHLSVSPNWTSPVCPPVPPLPVHEVSVSLSLRRPLEHQEEQEVCMSVLSGQQVVGTAGGVRMPGRLGLFPGIAALGMLSRSKFAWSW